ncbi:MAG TPA: FMN-binding protein [Tissierellaceae bacterium]|nr:FMN-binding protein [Tissierellaceae bacterium]
MKRHVAIFLVLVLAAATLVGCGGAKYNDGTYQGEAQGAHGPVKVSVEIKDGEIANVEVTEHEENMDHAGPAFDQIPKAIVDKNSTDVDAESGATVTSNAIKEAVDKALEEAK